MNTDSKLHNVDIAIGMIRKALEELRYVAKWDGERGADVSEKTLDLIDQLVNDADDVPCLTEWRDWIEADLGPEDK